MPLSRKSKYRTGHPEIKAGAEEREGGGRLTSKGVGEGYAEIAAITTSDEYALGATCQRPLLKANTAAS